jgi:dCMP deaminase
MKERISRLDYFKEMVQVVSKRATCGRACQGAIIVKENRVISTGYNGPVSRSKHCEELGCNVNESCKVSVHAEANSIYFAAKHGIATEGASLYCSTAPCHLCAQAIIQAGITEVFYINDYRDRAGIEILESSKVEVSKL